MPIAGVTAAQAELSCAGPLTHDACTIEAVIRAIARSAKPVIVCRLSLAPRPPSAVTRSIYLGTLAAIAVVATLSMVIYRSAVDEAVAQHSSQQLAMVRTAAVGVQGEIQAMTARLRQFGSLPERAESRRPGPEPARRRRIRRERLRPDQPDRARRCRRPAVFTGRRRASCSARARRLSATKSCGNGRRIAPTPRRSA